MEQKRKKEVMQFARGIYTFALCGRVDFDAVVECIERLGNEVVFYTDKEADMLNKKHNCPNEGVDFREIYAATNWNPKSKRVIVYFHKRKGRPSPKMMLHSALHELGHIVLNHYKRIGKERDLCEEEADIFYKTFVLIEKGDIKTSLGVAK